MNYIIKIPPYIETVLSALKADGYKAYAVGGCIRDSIMGREPYDWDVTTSALPEETMKCFSGYKIIDTGIKHGTVAIVIDEKVVEITTFRTEGSYSDNRHPDKVSFVRDINEDLSRRDFTVNSIAYNPDDGLIDPFGGINDIKNRIIRCVGEPSVRFSEDALRIMRAIRFASVLNFKIDKKTSDCIHQQKELINNVAIERTNVELSKLLCGKNVYNVIMQYSDVIFTVIPELKKTFGVSQNCDYHMYDVWEHTCVAVKEIEPELELRLAMLLHDIGKPDKKTVDKDGTEHFKKHAEHGAEIAERVLKRLRYSNKLTSVIKELIIHHDDRFYNDLDSLAVHASKFGFDFLYKLDKISRADIKSQNIKHLHRIADCDRFLQELEKLKNSNSLITLKELAINGKDLEEMGFKGREIGEKLEEIFNEVLLGKTENNRQCLLEKARRE